MGWTKHQFFKSFPAEYVAAIRHAIQVEKRADFRAGLITAQLANMFRGKEEERAHPLDYFPQHQKEKETYEYRLERRRAAVAQLNALKFKAVQSAREKKEKAKDG